MEGEDQEEGTRKGGRRGLKASPQANHNSRNKFIFTYPLEVTIGGTSLAVREEKSACYFLCFVPFAS
jgi:hypothetical protein